MSWMFQPSRPERHWAMSCRASARSSEDIPPSPVFSEMPESREAIPRATFIPGETAP